MGGADYYYAEGDEDEDDDEDDDGPEGVAAGRAAPGGLRGFLMKKSLSTPALHSLITSPPMGFLRAPGLATYQEVARDDGSRRSEDEFDDDDDY